MRKILIRKFKPFMPEVLLTSVICSFETFRNYFEIKLKFTKYLKESCAKGSDQHILFNYFWKNMCTKILPN